MRIRHTTSTADAGLVPCRKACRMGTAGRRTRMSCRSRPMGRKDRTHVRWTLRPCPMLSTVAQNGRGTLLEGKLRIGVCHYAVCTFREGPPLRCVGFWSALDVSSVSAFVTTAIAWCALLREVTTQIGLCHSNMWGWLICVPAKAIYTFLEWPLKTQTVTSNNTGIATWVTDYAKKDSVRWELTVTCPFLHLLITSI